MQLLYRVLHSCKVVDTLSHDVQGRATNPEPVLLLQVGRDLLYSTRLESRVRVGAKNKAGAGIVLANLSEDMGRPAKVRRRDVGAPCALPALSRDIASCAA